MRPAVTSDKPGPPPPPEHLRFRGVTNFEERSIELAAQLRDAQRQYRELWDMLTACDEDHLRDLHRLEDTEAAHNECKTRLTLALEDQAQKAKMEKENKVLQKRVTRLEQMLIEADEKRKQEKRDMANEIEERHAKRHEQQKERVAQLLVDQQGLKKRNGELKAIIAQFKVESASHVNTETILRASISDMDRDTRAAKRQVVALERQLKETKERVAFDAELRAQDTLDDRVEQLEVREAYLKQLLEQKLRQNQELSERNMKQAEAYNLLEQKAREAAANAIGLQYQLADVSIRMNLLFKAVENKDVAKEILNRNLPMPKGFRSMPQGPKGRLQ